MKRMTYMIVVTLILAGTLQAMEINENMSLGGDVRYRHEMIDQEGKETRTRHRVRARVELQATVNDELKAGFKLASGSSDPVSSNQTLDDSFSSKGINLDKAYFDWTPKMLGGLNLIGGKMGKPWITVSDLVWDGDLNPEGLAAKFTVGSDIRMLCNAGGFWLDERSSDSDTMLYAGQVAMEVKKGAVFMAGVGYYHFTEMEGRSALFDPTDSFGNSADEVLDDAGAVTALDYRNGFKELELFANVSFKAGAVPVSVYGQLVINTDADDNDTGFLVGLGLGKAKEPGQVEFGYNYRKLEKNAVVGALTDSDSFGGGTDGSGHKVTGKLKIAKDWDLGVTYFMQEVGLDISKDYDRLQVDLALKF